MNASRNETESLLRRTLEGDAEAVGELLDLHRNDLNALARRMLDARLAARIDASDIVQQTMLSACGKIGDFGGDDPDEFRAWLRMLHERNLQDAIRANTLAQRRDVRREVNGVDPSSDHRRSGGRTSVGGRLVADEEAERLAGALGNLPDDQAEAVRLRYVQGLPVREIGSRMGRSTSAVGGLLKRGLKALRAELGHLREQDE